MNRMTKKRRKRWLKNRLRIQRRLGALERTRRFEDAIDKIFCIGKYEDKEKVND